MKKVKKAIVSRNKQILGAISGILMFVILFLATSCAGRPQSSRVEEIVFHSGEFKIVGDLRLPGGSGPYPVVVFVHGDGPNNRTAGGTYLPIMERMASAGYATFAWDKPGTGESTGEIDRNNIGEQRAQIVLDAIEVLKARPEIDAQQIGLWGISQAGVVMPRVLSLSEDIAFMIAVSCPGMPGVDQGAHQVSAQAVCTGCPKEAAEQMKILLAGIERVQTYPEYVDYKLLLDASPCISSAAIFGYQTGVRPEGEWHAPNLESEYFWNPITVIEQITIPVLAFYGARDTLIDPIQGAEAYQEALTRAGNTNFRVELIPGTDHNIILSETGCQEERDNRPRKEWTNYAPEYLDMLEEWLKELRD